MSRKKKKSLDEPLNYIHLLNNHWNLRAQGLLDAGCSDLYLYLVHFCNSLGWKNPFNLSNKMLAATLATTEKTVIARRARLIKLGLLGCESGNSIIKNSVYYLRNYSSPYSSPYSSIDGGGSINSTSYNKPNQTKPNRTDYKAASPPISQLSLVAREKEFYESLEKHVDTYGKDMIRKFFDYWREPNRLKTKMRWEQQNTWDLLLRLKRWASNDFEKGKQDPVPKKTNLSEVVKQIESHA